MMKPNGNRLAAALIHHSSFFLLHSAFPRRRWRARRMIQNE
jgi:hypothetical protein